MPIKVIRRIECNHISRNTPKNKNMFQINYVNINETYVIMVPLFSLNLFSIIQRDDTRNNYNSRDNFRNENVYLLFAVNRKQQFLACFLRTNLRVHFSVNCNGFVFYSNTLQMKMGNN